MTRLFLWSEPWAMVGCQSWPRPEPVGHRMFCPDWAELLSTEEGFEYAVDLLLHHLIADPAHKEAP